MAEKYIKLSDVKKVIEDYRSEQTMSKYGSLEACMDAKFAVTGAMKELDYIPAADVVPKIEVENDLDKLLKQIGEIADNNKRWADAMICDAYARLCYEGIQKGALLAMLRIAELKKKYTEGET